MKNKKLFAILTLVCFMFTLMPVAAFAATTDPAVLLSEVKVGGKTDVEALKVSAGDEVSAKVENGEGTYWFFVLDEEGALYAAASDKNLKIKDAGKYDVYAIAKGDAEDINEAYILKAERLEAYMESESLVDEYAVLTVKSVDADYEITFDGDITGDLVEVAANGEYGAATVVATLETAGGKAVKGAELKFDDNGVDVTKVSSVTDRKGQFEFKISGTTVGNFEVEVSYGDVEEVIKVQVGNVGPAKVETVAEPSAPVDVDTDLTAAGMGFKLVDANGNVIKGATDGVVFGGEYKVSVVEEPADSDLADLKDEDALALAWDADKAYWEVCGAELAFEGDYTFKVALENGANAKASVTVKEFDETVAIKLVYNKSNIGLGDTVGIYSLVAVDANGVTKSLLNKGKVDGKVELAANGKAVETFAANGDVTAKSDDKYIGSKITVTAVYDEEFFATAEIAVVEDAMELVLTDTTAEAGVTNNLNWNIVNGEGELVALNVAGVDATTASAIVLEKPADAYVAAGANVKAGLDKVNMNFTPSAAGEYKVQVYVTYKEGDVNRYISGVATITVGAKAAVNDIVVMSIGATKFVVNDEVKEIPTAPVIENGRTMVPLRALIEAFGADVVWDDAARTVTVTLDGTVVVMTVGSAEYTVNGVAKTADVAPYINADNYTMVPVRFVAQAFGITPTPIADATGAVVDVMFAK